MDHPDTSGFDWDDLRIFLATMRAASLRRAARELGVSRQTAARRLAQLEARLSLRLFERRADGLHATAQGAALLAVAEEAERAMSAVARAADALDDTLRGPLRLTTPAVVAAELLMDDLVAFARRYPEVDLQLSGSVALEDLARRRADVAIRFMPPGQPPGFDLAGRRVGVAFGAVYGEGESWIGQAALDPALVAATPFAHLPVRGSITEGAVLRAACVAGMGLTFLPCFLGPPELRRTDPVPMFDIWVVVHQDLRRTPRFRVFRDAMVEALKAKRDRLEGR
ncbi:MAG: LysR family transcriptional regulator [Myxococcota bacterium]